MTLLAVEAVETHIGQFHILQGVSFDVAQGAVTVLLGRNGAGKTTTLRTIMGFLPATCGRIAFKGEPLHGLPPYAIARKGIGYVPEDAALFPELTVAEHVRLAMRSSGEAGEERLAWLLELFPDLKRHWHKRAGHLSGGQKQMLAIAQACVNDNDLLLVDEPSKGLAPIVVEKLMAALAEMKAKTTILLVEQNFWMASGIGDRYYILDNGRVVRGGRMEELADDEALKRKYLGIA